MMTVEQFFNTLMAGDAPGSEEEYLPLSIYRGTDEVLLCYGRLKEYFEYCREGNLDKLGYPTVVKLSQWKVISFTRIRPCEEFTTVPEYNWPMAIRII